MWHIVSCVFSPLQWWKCGLKKKLVILIEHCWPLQKPNQITLTIFPGATLYFLSWLTCLSIPLSVFIWITWTTQPCVFSWPSGSWSTWQARTGGSSISSSNVPTLWYARCSTACCCTWPHSSASLPLSTSISGQSIQQDAPHQRTLLMEHFVLTYLLVLKKNSQILILIIFSHS